MIYNDIDFINKAITSLNLIDNFRGKIDLSEIDEGKWYLNDFEMALDDIILQIDKLINIANTIDKNHIHSLMQNEDFFWCYIVDEEVVFVTRNRNDLIGILEAIVSLTQNTNLMENN